MKVIFLVFTLSLMICTDLWAAGRCIGPALSPASYVSCVQEESRRLIEEAKIHNLQEIAPVVESFLPNADLHTFGQSQSDMFRIQRDGVIRIVKVLREKYAYGENYKTYYERTIFGVLLAAELGGPAITSVGKLADGTYFYEMEELFPNEKDSFNFKKIRISANYPTTLSHLVLDTHLQQIARMLKQNLEFGIFMNGDMDLMFSKSEVRWIDAGWKAASSSHVAKMGEPQLRGLLYNYAELLRGFYVIDKKKGFALTQYFHLEIQKSKLWTAADKMVLHATMNESLLHEVGWRQVTDVEKYFIFDVGQNYIRCEKLF